MDFSALRTIRHLEHEILLVALPHHSALVNLSLPLTYEVSYRLVHVFQGVSRRGGTGQQTPPPQTSGCVHPHRTQCCDQGLLPIDALTL
jgi:hypothetical protein